MIRYFQLLEESSYPVKQLLFMTILPGHLLEYIKERSQNRTTAGLIDGSNPKVAVIKKASERINKKGHVTMLGKAGIHRIPEEINIIQLQVRSETSSLQRI